MFTMGLQNFAKSFNKPMEVMAMLMSPLRKHITSVALEIDSDSKFRRVSFQRAIDGLVQVPNLKHLILRFQCNELCSCLSLNQLVHMQALTSLELYLFRGRFARPHFQAYCADVIRQMPQLCSFSFCYVGDFVNKLLVQPHRLQLTKLHGPGIKIADCIALAGLPSLRTLRFDSLRLDHADFIENLPLLTDLHLQWNMDFCLDVNVNTERVVRSLQTCTKLQKLYLKTLNISAAQLCQMIPYTPQLASLSIHNCMSSIDSLEFLATGTLASTLTRLELGNLGRHVPIDELPKLRVLGALKALVLDVNFTFSSRLSDDAIKQFTPPSNYFPKLEEFLCGFKF